MIRFVKVDGAVHADPEARRPGRGAYLCPDAACVEQATSRRGFQRSFRAPVSIPHDLLESTG